MPINPNVTIVVAGDCGTGKTHFACTAPNPILFHSFDLGAEWLIERSFKDSDITLKKYTLPLVNNPAQIVKGSQAVWEQFAKNFKAGIDEGYKTIVLDTNTALWELCRLAYQEDTGLVKIAPLKYVEPNARMRALFTQAQIAGVNLISVHHLKDIYVDNQVAGRGIAGWSESDRYADFVIQTGKTRVVEEGKRRTKMTYSFTKARWERDLEGDIIEDLTFADMMALSGFE